MDASVELVKHVLPSVVHIHTEVPSAHPSTRILGDERMGTGTVVSRDGLILTVNYVVMGGKTIEVTFERGRSQRAEIIAQDFDVGLALLKVRRQGVRVPPMSPSGGVARAPPIRASGAGRSSRSSGRWWVWYTST